MVLTGKLIAQLEFKAGGDVFHEFFRHKPHQLADACVGKVHACNLVEGEFGNAGCVVFFKYSQGNPIFTCERLHLLHLFSTFDYIELKITDKFSCVPQCLPSSIVSNTL